MFFILISTFSPGPGNITSAAMGMNYGYRDSMRFLSGIVSGYLLIRVLCLLISSSLLTFIPKIEPVLRLLGTAYILKLAYTTMRASYNMSSKKIAPLQFKHGFLLPVLNPKAIIFGLTVYTTLFSGLVHIHR